VGFSDMRNIKTSKSAVSSIEKYIKYKENCELLITKNDKMKIINDTVKEYMEKNRILIDNEGWSNYRKIDVYLLYCKPRDGILNLLHEGIIKK
jgi:hypothetical protein